MNIAVLESISDFILVVPAWIVMCFVSVMLVPIVYYLFIPVWLTKSWIVRLQFWAGLFMYIFCGPFLNIAVLLYASFYMDSFGWGKTRKVITEDESTAKSEKGLEEFHASAEGVTEKPVQSSALAQTSRNHDEERAIGR
jgi:chitin synthase